MKSLHEKWVRESLESFDPQRQRDEEIYASYAEKWIELADVNNWLSWSSWIFSQDQPAIPKNIDRSLRTLRQWLLSRIWPNRYIELDDAFENFRRVLQDFQNTFHEYAEEHEDMIWTRRFYRIDDRNRKLLNKYEFHVGLVQDLMLELTRAGNYICDKLRVYINPVFRINEGVLIVESGPYMFPPLSYRQHRVAYRNDERVGIPYTGIKEFKKIRENRDFSFDIVTSDTDPRFLEWLKKTNELPEDWNSNS